MIKKTDIGLIIAFILAMLLIAIPSSVSAEEGRGSIYYPIQIGGYEKKQQPIVVHITQEHSARFAWKAGKKIQLKLYVQDLAGKRHYVRDAENKDSWEAVLDKNARASVSFIPSIKNYTGWLIAEADGQILFDADFKSQNNVGHCLEKTYEFIFLGGVAIKIHYTDQILEEGSADPLFPKEVLDSAVTAYQTITQLEGFNSAGFSFENPNTDYAYDPDKIIDIYLGSPTNQNHPSYHGFTQQSFKDAPCFDTVKESGVAYQAVILLPANYHDFIKKWEKLNPSPLGKRNLTADLRGTLIHEMLHTLLFYYNKNLNREALVKGDSGESLYKKNLDWYVEGLARYFETLVGANHDFYSQGFKEILPDKIRFSRGGSNYYMRYPDQSFTELRYENALFWRFIHYEYGMKTIEDLSRHLRSVSPKNFSSVFEKVTGVSFHKLLKKYALSVLTKDFGLKERVGNLNDIAKTRLIFRGQDFILMDGYGNELNLGDGCRTDWVGQWGNARAGFGQMSVAGDSTDTADVSGWATDYLEIKIENNTTPPVMILYHEEGRSRLGLQVVLTTQAGALLTKDMGDVGQGQEKKIDIKSILKKEGIDYNSVATIDFLITNFDPEEVSIYQLKSL